MFNSQGVSVRLLSDFERMVAMPVSTRTDFSLLHFAAAAFVGRRMALLETLPRLESPIWPSLRRSREMTLLCSPKVTQHHQRSGCRICCPTRTIMPVCKHQCRESDRSHTSPFSDVCDRSRLHRRRSRRALAQMMETQTARCRVDDIAGTVQPTGNPVLRVGHSKRAEVDQFC